MPQLAVYGFLETRGHFRQRIGVAAADEFANRVVGEIGIVKLIEVMILNDTRGGRESEQIVHRRRHLKSALVAVPHDRLDPLRIGGAGPHDTPDLIVEGSHPRALRPAVVVVVDDRLISAQASHGGGQPPLELVIVVAIEEIVFAIVLVVDDGIDRPRGGF